MSTQSSADMSLEALSQASEDETTETDPTSDESSEESCETEDNDRRKRRTAVTQRIVRSLIVKVNDPQRPPLRVIARSLDISMSTLTRLLKKIREERYDFGKKTVFIPNKKGRKSISSKERIARVKAVLTSDPTMTWDRAREILAAEGINMGRTTIWRIARKKAGLSVQMISMKPGVVFGQQIMQRRFDYAQQVDELPDDMMWFLDESGFNLQTAPLRCWSPLGRTPVVPVHANRGVNVSLLMCISPSGIVFFKVKVGSFKADDFVEFLEALADHFPEVQSGQVSLVMDNAKIHHARVTKEFLRENEIKHIFLPPYSPDLNSIEMVFGVLKHRYRSRGVVQNRAWMKRRIENIVLSMNRGMDVRAFYQHMRQFVERAINRE